METNLKYYKHKSDSDSNSKFKALRKKYGWAGEAKFWALNNRIARELYCKLDINKKYVWSDLSDYLEFKEAGDFLIFIDFLASKECNLIINKDGILTTKQTQEDLKTLNTTIDNKSQAGKEGMKKRWLPNRKDKFYEKVLEIIPEVTEKDYKEFCEYWTEHGENDNLMRHEKQTSFDIKKRYNRWINNPLKNNKDANTQMDESKIE